MNLKIMELNMKIKITSLKYWTMLDDLEILVNSSKSARMLNKLLCFWYFWIMLDESWNLSTLRKMIFWNLNTSQKMKFGNLWDLEILLHLGKSFLGIFEILNNYGTSWKFNILESPPPLNIATPTPAWLWLMPHGPWPRRERGFQPRSGSSRKDPGPGKGARAPFLAMNLEPWSIKYASSIKHHPQQITKIWMSCWVSINW